MSRSPAKPWGKRDLITLRSAARRREPVKSVAKRLGRTTAATQQKAMRMGWQFRQTKRARTFRALMDSLGAKVTELPAGTFATSGTQVRSLLITIKLH